MQYVSTRDKTIQVPAAKAVLQGLSPEGGLFLPAQIPQVDEHFIKEIATMDYIGRAKAVLRLFLTDFTDEELSGCVQGAYGGGKFDENNPAPVAKVGEGVYFLELWHGPTCAFKDMALQLLPRLMSVSSQKNGNDKDILILVATSGDTGKAALEGFRDLAGVKMITFYPEDGVSELQKRQMNTQKGENLYVAAVNGNFDDAQAGVKEIFSSEAVSAKLAGQNKILSSANSINWGRLVPQIVYYFSAYCDLLQKEEIFCGQQVNICVPTGNFGNILAAYYAKRMGLPVGKLVAASNKNNVLADFIETGVFDKNRDFYPTISPSMDILLPSNLERMLYYLLDESDSAVRQMMEELKASGRYTLPAPALEKLKTDFAGGYLSDEETKQVIANLFYKYGYLCDTHTAVAAGVYANYQKQTGDEAKVIIASTASAYKFPEAVLAALGKAVDGGDAFAAADTLETITAVPMPAALKELKDLPVRFGDCYEKDGMAGALEKI